MKSALAGIPVNRAMLTEFHSLQAADPLSRAVDLILKGSQRDFPVIEDNRVIGVLTREALFAGLQQRGDQSPVSAAVCGDVEVVDSFEMLDSVFARLQAEQCHTLPVVHGGQVVGLLTMDNVGEFLAVQAAISSTPTRPHGA